MKRTFADFLCAFMAFVIVLSGIAVLSGGDFLEGTVAWDGKEGALSVFGTEILFDKNALSVAKRLVSANDAFFGEGFSEAVLSAGSFVVKYVSDGISLAYCLSKAAVGAE